jgi:hypothetical protein
MNVGAVSAIGSGTPSVYALLSPYLNGVVRTSNAAAAAQLQASAAATSAAATQTAIAARAAASASTTAAPPFANPAITAIAERIALGESLVPLLAVTPNALLAPTSALAATATPLAAATTADATLIPAQAAGNALATTTTVATDTTPLNAPPPVQQPSPTNQVLFGDGGTLIQSYGAVALATGVLTQTSAFAQPVTPAIPAATLVTPVPRVAKVA